MRSTLGGGWVVGLRPSYPSVGEMRLLLMPSMGKSTRVVDPLAGILVLLDLTQKENYLRGAGGQLFLKDSGWAN